MYRYICKLSHHFYLIQKIIVVMLEIIKKDDLFNCTSYFSYQISLKVSAILLRKSHIYTPHTYQHPLPHTHPLHTNTPTHPHPPHTHKSLISPNFSAQTFWTMLVNKICCIVPTCIQCRTIRPVGSWARDQVAKHQKC